MKIHRFLCLFLIFLLLLSGCQKPPETAAVVSKNDGSLEAALSGDAGENGGIRVEQPAAESTPQPEGQSETEPMQEKAKNTISYEDSFTSTDGSVTFTISDKEVELPQGDLQVLRVQPMVFGPEEAKAVVHAIFGDAPVYEYSEELTKSEIEDRIIEYRQAITDEAIREAYGENLTQEEYEGIFKSRQEILDRYEALYQEASDDIEQEECQWLFWDDSKYSQFSYTGKEKSYASKEEFPGVVGRDDGDVALVVSVPMDGTTYKVSFHNLERNDFRNHSVGIFPQVPNVVGGHEIEAQIWKDLGANSYDMPSEETLRSVEARAQAMVDAMGLGEFKAVASIKEGQEYVQGADGYSVPGRKTYTIEVKCYRLIGSVHSLDQSSISQETGEYAARYYYEDLNMLFGVTGKLITFSWWGPLEIVGVENANVPVLSWEEIQDRVKGQLSLSDAEAYAGKNFIQMMKEMSGPLPVSGEVEISQAEIGMVRVPIKDNRLEFYLVPALELQGIVNLYDEDGVRLDWWDYMMAPSGEMPLRSVLVLNLLDGSVVSQYFTMMEG